MAEASHLLAVAELAAFFPAGQRLVRSTHFDFPLGNVALVQLLESGGTDSWEALEGARAALEQDSSLEKRQWRLDGEDERPLVEVASTREGWDAWRADHQADIEYRHSLLVGFEPFKEEVGRLHAGEPGVELGRGGRSVVMALSTTVDGREFAVKLPDGVVFPTMGFKRGWAEDYISNLARGERGFESIEAASYLPAIVSEKIPGVDLEDLAEADIGAIPVAAVQEAARNLVWAAGQGIRLDPRGVRNWRFSVSPQTGEGVFTFLDYYKIGRGPIPKLAADNIWKFAQALYYAGSGQKTGGVTPRVNYTATQRQRRTRLLDALYEEAARLCPEDPHILERVQKYRAAANGK